MSPIFAKMSVAIASPPAAIGTILETAGGPNRPIQYYSATGDIEPGCPKYPVGAAVLPLDHQSGPWSTTRR